MGWLFGWNDRRSVVRHIVDMYADQERAHSKIVRASLVGNHWWGGMEITTAIGDDARLQPGGRWIALYLLQGGGQPGYRWGYKDLEESMGPCEVDCPLYLLDLVPDPGWTWDGEPWRDRVRAYHQRRNRQFRIGDAVCLPAGFKPREFIIVSVKPLRGTGPDGRRYRLPRAHIEPVEKAGEPITLQNLVLAL